MKRLQQVVLVLTAVVSIDCSLRAEEAVCPLCESVRAYNREHPQKYEYYEDYLDSLKNGDDNDQQVPPEKPVAPAKVKSDKK